MADRRVKVNLELDAKGYSDGAKQASKATQDLQKSVLDAEKAASQSGQKVSDAYRKQQDAAGKLRVAEEQLKKARDSGDAAKLAAAEERVESAKRNNDEATRRLTSAEEAHASASDRAAAAQANLATETDKAASASEKLGQFIDDNRSDMQTAGTALAGVGAAIGVLGAAVANTGIEYNTLQQTSGAALKTIMGDASAAADQMDRLDEFAANSPFSKAVFIEAQQQLLAFGTEAERVVPILDAVQNAVAATGGSNQDISELVTIIAKVGSTGKLTAEDLNQLGERGVDAATVIGEQMGMSGAAIREEITAGTLDADAAIVALTDGMSENFDGAAAGVKDTFVGAMDRIKAAWRDVSAELMTPLVNPDGGGMLIDLANNVADVMRAFQDLPDPVKNGVAALGGVAGVAAGGTGALLLLAPAALDTWRAFQSLKRNLPGVVSVISDLGKAGAAAGVLTGMAWAARELANHLRPAAASITEIQSAILDLEKTGDSTDLSEMFTFEMPQYGDLFGLQKAMGATVDETFNLASALDKLQLPGAMDHLDSFFADIGFRNNIKDIRDQFEGLDIALSTMDLSDAASQINTLREEAEAGGNMDLSGWESLTELFPEYTNSIREWANQAGVSTEAADLFQYAMGNIPDVAEDGADGIEGLGGAMEDATAPAEELAASFDEIVASLFELGRANRTEAEAQGAFAQAVRDADAALKENGQNFDVNTEKGYANMQAINAVAAEMETLAEAQARGGATTGELTDSMQSAYDEVLRLTGGNEELTRTILGIPDEKSVDIWATENAMEMALATAREIEALPDHTPVSIVVSDDGTAGQVQSRVNEITGKTEYVFVTDDGTSVEVQREIRNIDGVRREVFVSDDGTVYETQQRISGVEDGSAVVHVSESGVSAVQGAINSIRGKRVNVDVVRRNFGQAAVADGGVVPKNGFDRLPRRSSGGQLPSYGLGTDTILGVGSSGQPTAWVDDGEWVIRRTSSKKYDRLLGMVNADHPSVQHLAGYATGGNVGREWSAMSAPMASGPVSASVDSGVIANAVASAISSYQPVVKIGMREFIGEMKQDRAWKGAS